MMIQVLLWRNPVNVAINRPQKSGLIKLKMIVLKGFLNEKATDLDCDFCLAKIYGCVEEIYPVADYW